MRANLLYLVIPVFIFACGNPPKKKPCPQTVFSKDVNELEKLLDLERFRPIAVQYKYVFCDNSGKDDRSLVPGPSDHYLQVLMYFDSLTFKNIWLVLSIDTEPHPLPKYKKDEFYFEWLTTKIKEELDRMDTSYHGHHDQVFGTNGSLWLMDNKLLLKDSSN